MDKDKCSKCGYDKHKGSLQIHHKDGNHENNTPSNLEVLCANCHFEHHQTNKRPNGLKRFNKVSINPDDLKDLNLEINELKSKVDELNKANDYLSKAIIFKNTIIEGFLKELPEHMEGYYYHNKAVVNDLYEEIKMKEAIQKKAII